MPSPATPEMEESREVPIVHRLKRVGKRVYTGLRTRTRKQKSRPRPGSTPSRVSTFSSLAAHDALPQRPKVENKTEKAPHPISPAQSPRPETAGVTTRSNNGCLWAQAYREAKENPNFVKLLESYNEFLVKRYGLSQKESTELLESLLNLTSGDQNTPIQKIAERTLNDLESNRLTFRIGDENIVVREQVQKVFDFLTPFKSVIGAAAAAEPSASLAWTGVTAALPFLENILKQDESAADGFKRISFVLVRYALFEKDLLHEKSESPTPIFIEHSRVIDSIKERIVKVYVIVYEYQIRIILQYAHTKPHRALRDMLLLDDWKKMTSDINEKDLEIDRAVNTMAHSSLRDGLKGINESIAKTMRTVLDAQKEISTKLDISILDRIPYVENAVFNSEVIDKQGKCLPGTQRNALNTIQRWAESPDGDPIFWLAGMAGTGKSTIAATVANCLHNRKQFFNSDEKLDSRTFLGATFFLSHEDPDRNTVKYVFPTIARTMAERYPDIGKYISQSIYRDTTVGTARIAEQMERLLSEPLATVSKPLLVSVRLIIIIDSIDECEKSSEAEQLLRLLTKLGGFHPLDVRVLVVSRPEKHISQILDDSKYRVERLILEKITPQIDGPDPDDITKFLRHEVADITKRRKFAQGWIKSEEMTQLIEKAGGLFIYAATTCRFLNVTDDDEIQGLRLEKLIEGTTDRGTPEARLDEIYRKVLAFPARNMSQGERELMFLRYRCILGSVALAFEPPSVVTIEKLLEREGIRKTVMDFRSILEVPADDQSPVSFFHLSFRDFLLSKERSGIDFAIDIAQTHHSLFQNCLAILDKSLHQDMCDLGHPGVFASEIPKRRIHEYIPQHVRYACLYWSDHLLKLSALESASIHLDDNGQVYGFFCTKFLYWLEVLSLLGEYHRSIAILTHLQSLATPEESPKLSSHLHDAYRFALSHNGTISQAPLQTYSSALIFSPIKSIVRARFLSLIPRWITRCPDWRDEWGPELMVLNSKRGRFDISKNGRILASSGLGSETKVWDLATGSEMGSLQHSSRAWIFAISRDGTTIASVLEDDTVSLWSLTDESATILTSNTKSAGNTQQFSAIVASPIDDVLASISDDYKITLWDLKTSKVIRQITFDEGENDCYNPLAFSPCGQFLVAGCGPATVGGIFVWNCKTQKQRNIRKHVDVVSAVAVSPDSQMIASSDRQARIKVWSIATEDTLRETTLVGRSVSIAWHPNEPWILALGSSVSGIQLCNLATDPPSIIKHIDLPGASTFYGLAFTGRPSILALTDSDGTVTLWDTEVASPAITRRACIHRIYFLNGNDNMVLVASKGSTEILDARTGSRQIFLTDIGKVTCSPAKDLFAFCCNNETIQFWDGTLKSLIKTFHQFTDVFFPKGGTLVVLMSRNKVLVLEYHTLNVHLQIELSREWVPWHEPIFTSQSLGIVTKGEDRGFDKLWLFRWDTGEVVPGFPHVIKYGGYWMNYRAVYTSPDGQLMLYKTTDDNNKNYLVVVNVEADYETSILALGQDAGSTSPAFSPTGNRLVIGTFSGTIFVWDKKTMALLNQLSTGASEISELHYCTDERITVTTRSSGSDENQLWDVERVQLLRRWKVDKEIASRHWQVEVDRQHFSINDGWLSSPVGDETASCGTLTGRDPNLLDVEGGWLWQGNDRLLLLPSDFAPGANSGTHGFRSITWSSFPVKAASTDSLVLGLRNGELAVFKFDRSKMLFKK